MQWFNDESNFRCKVDSSIRYLNVGPTDDKRKRFSLDAFEFVAKKGATVYLHAVVQVCTGTDADE